MIAVSGDYLLTVIFCSKIGMIALQGTLGSRKKLLLEVPDG